MDEPRQPSGSDAEYVFHQKTHHELYSGKNEILSAPGVRVSQTTRGRKVQFTGQSFKNQRVFYPFKIYQSGDWLTYKVRLGSLFSATYYLHDKIFALLPSGTDGVEWPDSNMLEGDFPSTTYELEENTITWFFVEITSAGDEWGDVQTAQIVVSSDPASDGWENYPAAHPYIIPIGFVDTDVFADKKKSMINQVQRGHIILPASAVPSSVISGTMQFYGQWTSVLVSQFASRGYPAGAVVYDLAGKHFFSKKWFNTANLSDAGWHELTAP